MYVKKQFRQPEIYGVTGRKGHGKDTFATLVVKANEAQVLSRAKSLPKKNFAYTHFAEALKTMSGRIFGLTREQMYDPALKEVAFAFPLSMDVFLAKMREETGLSTMQPAGRVAHSPREVMQYFGTDYVRITQDNYWVQRTMAFAKSQRRVLIPDTRFPNEANAIHEAGGRVIKIVRLGVQDSGDAHASETSIDQIDPDLLLMVKTGDLSLVQRVATLIAQGKFEAALKYDWRRAEKAMDAYAAGAATSECVAILGFTNGSQDPYVLNNLLDYYERPRRKRNGAPRIPHEVVDGVSLKFCSTCAQKKPLGEFNRMSKAWDGLAGVCRPCASERNKDSYQKYGLVQSVQAVLREMKRRAPKRGFDFNLTLEDVEGLWSQQGGRCYYSGIEMTPTVSDPNKMSIDRLDSSKGYMLGNVVLCTKRINLMKREMSVREFLGLVHQISLKNFAMLHKDRDEVLQVLQSL